MRLDTLRLIAFGPFTDFDLDLSAGREGLHLVYGPNEAGKSTALRAITQLLYGIPVQSPDAFRHGYADMRIGARLAGRDGDAFDFVRRKGKQKTVRDANDDAPLNEADLQRFLGGVTQQVFQSMFGIHHEELIKGGQAILQGGGDVGQTLFAAAAGVADLRLVLGELDKEAEALFASRGSVRSINAALAGLKEKRKAVKDLLLTTEEWASHDAAFRQALGERDELERALRLKSVERNRLERMLKALPLIAKRREVLAELDKVADAVLLAADFPERRKALEQQRQHAEAVVNETTESLRQIGTERDALSINDALLAQGEVVEDLKAQLGIHRKALKDRDGKLKPELGQFLAQGRALLVELRPGMSLDEAEALRLTAAQRRRVQDLSGKSESLVARAEDARKTLEGLHEKREAVRKALDGLGDIREPGDLERALRRARRRGEVEDQLRDARLECQRLEQQSAVDLAALGLWPGGLDDLEKARVPSVETTERYERDLDEAVRCVAGLEQRVTEVQERERDATDKIGRLKRERDVPTEETLANARQVRDDAWRRLRDAWKTGRGFEADFASTYESSVHAADEVADRLRREADRVAALAQLEATSRSCAERLTALDVAMKEALEKHRSCLSGWASLWRDLGIEPRSPREMMAWMRQRDALVQEARALREARVSLASIEELANTHATEIRALLEALGKTTGEHEETFAALLDRAEAIVQQHNAFLQGREQCVRELAALEDEQIPRAERLLEAAEAALGQWRQAWQEAIAPLGLPPDAAPGDAHVVLDRSAELFTCLEAAAAHRKRIDAIDADYAAFTERVRELAAHAAPALAALLPDQACQALYEELRQAREGNVRREAQEKQRRKEELRHQEARTTVQRATEALDAMCREARVDAVERLPEAEDWSHQRRAREAERDGLNEKLIDLSSGHTLGEFIDEVSLEDPDALAPNIGRLDDEIDALRAKGRTLSEQIGSERERLDQMDGRGAAAQAEAEAQGLLATIAAEAEQYARLHIASAVLRRAVERFRERNQAPMLARASRFFAGLTCGSFEGLRADYNDKGEPVIVGVRPGGRALLDVQAMSDGAADQLYLSLRLAGLDLYLEENEALPFIVDDVLVNFDDERAAAALGALAEVSRKTQVIFFTHHRHLVALARSRLDADTLIVHELAEPVA